MKRMFLVVAFAIALFTGVFASNYTKLVVLEDQVNNSYKDMQGGFIALANTVEPLAKASSHWMLNHRGIISDMRDAAYGLHSAKSLGGYHDSYEKLSDTVQHLSNYANALFVMNLSKDYSRTMESYKEADKNVQHNIEVYNVITKQYNDCLGKFPYIMTGRIMGFAKKEYF